MYFKLDYTIPDPEYRKIQAISGTDAGKLYESPYEYLKSKEMAFKPTAAMQFGTMVHMAILEPSLFNSKYCLAGSDEYYAGNELKKKVILGEDAFKLTKVIEAVNNNNVFNELLADIKTEVAVFNKFNDVDIKGKIDILPSSGNCLLDLKTTKSVDEFAESGVKYKYHIQAAHYCNLFSGNREFVNMKFICVQNNSIPAVGIWQVKEQVWAELVSDWQLVINNFNEASLNKFPYHMPYLDQLKTKKLCCTEIFERIY